MSEWYETSFGEDYLIVYRHRDFGGARHEVETMIGWLDLPRGARVLDLCCGMGRHSLALSEAGYEVTGVDLSEALLREARSQVGAEAVTWLRSDMRELSWRADSMQWSICLLPSDISKKTRSRSRC